MALPGFAHLGLGDKQRLLGLAQLPALRIRGGQPFRRRGHPQPRHARRIEPAHQQPGGRSGGQLGQHLLPEVGIELGGLHLRRHRIGPGLGLAHVGDRHGADGEAAPGERQLLGGGHALGPRQGQRVARLQHLETGLDQPLRRLDARLRQGRLRLLELRLRRVEAGEQGGAKQRLRHLQRQLLAAKGPQVEVRRFAVARLGLVGRDPHCGPQGGPRLGDPLLSGPHLGLGAGDGGVHGEGAALQIGQRLRRHGCRRARAEQRQDEHRAADGGGAQGPVSGAPCLQHVQRHGRCV